MEALAWIIVSGLAMSGIALIGGLTLFLKDSTLQRITLPLVDDHHEHHVEVELGLE